MTDAIDRSPARLTGACAVAAGIIVTAATAVSSAVSLAVGALGVVLVTAAVLRGTRRVLSAGVGMLFVGVLAAGLFDASLEALLVALAATILAWDFGEYAVGIGEQLGRAADTRRAELTHVGASTLLAAGGAGVGYLVYSVATGGQPMAALVLLLFGAVLLIAALRD